MGHVIYRDGVAILQLIFYAPALACAIALGLRHGFAKSSGWVLLITFSAMRLAGAICSMVYIDHPGEGLLIAIIVLAVMGLAPLTLVTWGVMSRLNQDIHIPIPRKTYSLVGSASIAGLVLGAYGASVATNGALQNPYSRAAVIIFTVIWGICAAGWCLVARQYSDIRRGERRVLVVCGLCLPLILVRVIHALIETWANDPRFNVYGGSTTIYLCMGVLEEIAIVAMMEVMGFTLKPMKVLQREQNAEMRADGGQEHGVTTTTTTTTDRMGSINGGILGRVVEKVGHHHTVSSKTGSSDHS